MTRRRWIADEVSGSRAALVGSHAEHLSRVLRAGVGQEFDIATGSDVRRGRITAITPDRVEFELGEEVVAGVSVRATVLLSIFKFDRMEWAIEKITELGTVRIVPVIARRTEARLAAAAGKRVERWRRIALQSAEQSRRSSPPEISAPLKVEDAAGMAGDTRILLSEVEAETMLKDVLPTDSRQGEIMLAFGPEGGWTDEELKLFQKAGWMAASLGSTILRTETAAIAALAVVLCA